MYNLTLCDFILKNFVNDLDIIQLKNNHARQLAPLEEFYAEFSFQRQRSLWDSSSQALFPIPPVHCFVKLDWWFMFARSFVLTF